MFAGSSLEEKDECTAAHPVGSFSALMATIDFNEHPDFDATGYDLVIVGAGAAGLFLASLLRDAIRVLVLESGHFAIDPRRQDLNDVVQTGKTLEQARWGRKRAVGGTTVAWGGQSLPFMEIDFEKRRWVQAREWPFRKSELTDHYRAANAAMGVDQLDYETEAFECLGYEPPPFDPSKVHLHMSKWAPEPNFRKVFAAHIETEVDVLYNAHVLDLGIGEGRVRTVTVSSFNGVQRTWPVGTVVLASGALETTRALLLAEARHGVFTEPQRQILGTGFMDHPCITAGTVELANPYAAQRAFATQLAGRRKYSVRLTASEAFVRENELLNLSASLMFEPGDEAFNPYTDFRHVRKLLARPSRIPRTANALARTAAALVAHRFVYKHHAPARIAMMCEQEPSAESRLRLHPTETDAFGTPRIELNWSLTPLVWHSVVVYAKALRDEIERLRIGRVWLRPEIEAGEEDRTDLLSDVNHHMGGTVLGADPDASIVDPDLRVRGLSNLYACSASVYPSGSHSNPTLTLLALTDRLAGHLRRQLVS